MILCHDCGVNVSRVTGIKEYCYMVHDHVWLESGLGKKDGFLCIGCLEARLGRRLVSEDFRDCLLTAEGEYQSPRLRSRITGYEGILK